jgi:hypothetical protein
MERLQAAGTTREPRRTHEHVAWALEHCEVGIELDLGPEEGRKREETGKTDSSSVDGVQI